MLKVFQAEYIGLYQYIILVNIFFYYLNMFRERIRSYINHKSIIAINFHKKVKDPLFLLS